jgi:hypothetical protein
VIDLSIVFVAQDFNRRHPFQSTTIGTYSLPKSEFVFPNWRQRNPSAGRKDWTVQEALSLRQGIVFVLAHSDCEFRIQ